MTSSSHRKKKSKEQSNNNQGILENWFAGDSEAMTRFIHETSRKQVNVPKVLEFSWLREENLTEAKTLLKHQKLLRNNWKCLSRLGESVLQQSGSRWQKSSLPCERCEAENYKGIWSNVGGIKYSGMKVSKGNTAGIQGFNKMQFYRSCVRNPAEPVARFHAGNLTLILRLLAYIISW